MAQQPPADQATEQQAAEEEAAPPADMKFIQVQEEAQILQMDKKYRDKAKDIDRIREQVAEAHRQHAEYLAR